MRSHNIFLILALIFFGASCGHRNIMPENDLVGRWEKVSHTTDDGAVTPFKPNEVILEYFNGGDMFAHYDDAKHRYRYTLKSDAIVSQVGSDSVHRVFDYKFNEDKSEVTMRQHGNGIISKFRRLK